MEFLLLIAIVGIFLGKLFRKRPGKYSPRKFKKYSPSNLQKSDQFDIEGRCWVVDADGISIGNHNIRLAGIDAPEHQQMGKFHTGEWLDQGAIGKKKLINFIGGKRVNAHVLGRDKYGRLVAKVYFDDIDVSQWIIEQGYAVAAYEFRKDYISFEKEARKNNKGMFCWDVSYDPRSWKAYKRTDDESQLRQIQNSKSYSKWS